MGIGIVELLLATLIVVWPVDYHKMGPGSDPAISNSPKRQNQSGTPETNDTKKIDTIKMLLERVNHLEGILSSSLFSLLISTTLAVGGGAYTIKDKRIPISGLTVFVGANFVYVLLSAQYYFMLTHFYSAMIFMIYQNQFVDIKGLSLLWIEFQSPMPVGVSKVPQFLYLLQATLPPLLFATMTILGLWAVFLKKAVSAEPAGWSDKSNLQLKTPDGASLALVTIQESATATEAQKALPFGVVFAAIAMHVLIWATMIWSPFLDFFMALYLQVRR